MFGKKPSAEERAAYRAFAAEVHTAIGALCEIRNKDNVLIFLGRIQDFDGVGVTITASNGGELPPVIFNAEFKVIVRPAGRSTLVWRGKICGSSPTFWKLDQLVRLNAKESRAHFRQRASAPAFSTCINDVPHDQRNAAATEELPKAPCLVVDISLGGIQIQSSEHYNRGDLLLITGLSLPPDEDRPFTLTCRVCWADLIGNNKFLFGCSFASMSALDQDLLCSAIFALQRIDLQSRRR